MYMEEIEVHSDAPNRVVLRVPWRTYPGALIQGDNLLGLSGKADRAYRALLPVLVGSKELSRPETAGLTALLDLREELRSLLKHYEKVTRWQRASRSNPSAG